MGLMEIRGESVLDTNRKMNRQYFQKPECLKRYDRNSEHSKKIA